MSTYDRDFANQLINRAQLDAVTLRQSAQDTNCNALVDVSYWQINYSVANQRLSLLAFVTPADPSNLLSVIRIVMESPDKSKIYGAAFTSLLQGFKPSGAPGVTLSPYVIAPFPPPGPDTKVLGTLDGTVQTSSGSCDFYFEQIFELNT
jgi:hypothetical protein